MQVEVDTETGTLYVIVLRTFTQRVGTIQVGSTWRRKQSGKHAEVISIGGCGNQRITLQTEVSKRKTTIDAGTFVNSYWWVRNKSEVE